MYGLLPAIDVGKFKLSDFTSRFRDAAGVCKLAFPKQSCGIPALGTGLLGSNQGDLCMGGKICIRYCSKKDRTSW